MSAMLSFGDYAGDRVFRTGCVVVGTGAGGAAAGAELAEAGENVLFVEEGSHHPTSSFSPYLTESVPRLYRNAGATAILGRPPIPYVEGRCVGGSTVINGGMAYRAPERVLDRWARETGVAELGPKGLARHYDRVESAIGVSDQIEASVGNDNRMMVEGARRHGWRYTLNPRAQRTCVGANNCGFGCPTGAKQSTLTSYLPRAFRAGAGCLTDVRVERLVVEAGRCAGVLGRAVDPVTRRPGPMIEVRADTVVVACGAIQTPMLLSRHRQARSSRQLGRNFLCHPNAKVAAIYPFDVHGWKGVSQLTQIREFSDEGILMAENFVAAGVLATSLPVHGRDAWEIMKRYNQTIASGVLVEDSTTGVVRRTPLGVPLARYDITPLDHTRFVKGVRLLAEMHFALGAELVVLPFRNTPFVRSVDGLLAAVSAQAKPDGLELFTVHLMGTARMGSHPRRSVVSPAGELWDLPGCYVADASLFPSAIGVNPQLTVMALATRIAEQIAERRQAA